jgi:hypothetical protein
MSFLELYIPMLAAFVSGAIILETLSYGLGKFIALRQEKKFKALEKKLLEMQERGEEPTPEMMAELMPYLYQTQPVTMPALPSPKAGSGHSTGHYL